MKIPKNVKIGGIPYEVKIVDCVCDMNKYTSGRIIYDSQEIKVQKGMGKEFTEMVLLHEILHGIFEDKNIENDEKLVDSIAKGLHQVITDNPELF